LTAFRRYRFLIRDAAELRSFVEINFSPRDSSVYIKPQAANETYWLGMESFPPGVEELEIDWTKGTSVDEVPHLSLHESGRLHARSEDKSVEAGPIQIGPLRDLRGQHVASISIDEVHPSDKQTEEAPEDVVVPLDSGAASGRVSIYINGLKEEFVDPCQVRVQLRRPSGLLFAGTRFFWTKASTH
jgi:hypothetical protein